jgi:uncharacterized protein (DUF58 family)
VNLNPTSPNKTDASNGSYGICRAIDASRSPSPDPKRSPPIKKLIWIIASLGAVGVLGVVIPWILRAGAAQPLIGVVDVQMKCMGGHEIFLEVTEDAAYDNCPGHRDRKMVARVVRDAKSVTVIDARDDQPWFRIDWNGSEHTLDFLKRPDSQSIFGMIPVRGKVEQVTNPWRLWLPLMLPED